MLPAGGSDVASFGDYLTAKLSGLFASRSLLELSDPVVFQLWLVAIVVSLWVSHRAPPIPTVWAWWTSR